MPITLNCSAAIARWLVSNPRPSFWGSLHAIMVKAHDPSEGVYLWPRVAETEDMKGMGGGR
jgi:hypothetical protein